MEISVGLNWHGALPIGWSVSLCMCIHTVSSRRNIYTAERIEDRPPAIGQGNHKRSQNSGCTTTWNRQQSAAPNWRAADSAQTGPDPPQGSRLPGRAMAADHGARRGGLVDLRWGRGLGFGGCLRTCRARPHSATRASAREETPTRTAGSQACTA